MGKAAEAAFVLRLCLLLSLPAAAQQVQPAPPAFGVFSYRDVLQPVVGSAIPGLALESPSRCAFLGIQHGSSESNVLYFVFDRDTERGFFRAVHVYSPGDAKYGSPVRVKGFQRRGEIMEFPPVDVASSFGDVKARTEIGFTSEGTTVRMAACCTLDRKGRRLGRFYLLGICNPATGVDRPAEVERLYEQPSVSCNFDHRSSPPKLAGVLKMGRWTLVPDSGMSAKVEVTVRDERNRKVVRDLVRLDDGDRGSFRFVPDRRIVPGQSYSADVAVNLGEFFGVVRQDRTLVPKKK